jgi:hypothetical protein
LLENGVDLFQLYSVGIQQKNRADVRLAIDALETVFTRPNIDIYTVVSGDSDFTELIHKLRDYGKYTIGIGLRAATSDLLRRACDEFIFYDTLVTEEEEEIEEIADQLQLPDPRDLLRRALDVAGQKGELPIFAGRLKQIMLGLNSSFHEANYGFQQFRAFLEAQSGLVELQEQAGQVYVTLPQPAPVPAVVPPPPVKPVADWSQRYRSFLRDVGMRVVEFATRQQVLADFVATVQAQAEPVSLNTVADLLKDRYDAENALTQKIAVGDMMRLLVMSGGLAFAGGQPSSDAPIRRAEALNPDALASACDTVYVWRLVEGGVPVYTDHLAPVLYDADMSPGRVAVFCQTLVEQRKLVAAGDTYAVSPEQINGLMAREELHLPAANLAKVSLPAGEPISPMTAESLFREASDLRQKDFAGSAQRYLQAARIQLDSLRAGHSRAGFDDLKWYLASYCSVKAGHAFVTGNYGEAAPYYLAFFTLAQEADSVWPRIQRLVTPMSSYFFAIAGKQLNAPVPPNLGRSPAHQVALRIHNHDNPLVAAAWENLMERLAAVNLGMIRVVYRDIHSLIGPSPQTAGDSLARIERTRTFLAGLIARRENAA